MKSFVFSLLLLFVASSAYAKQLSDTIPDNNSKPPFKILSGSRHKADTVVFTSDTVILDSYEKRVRRYRFRWAALVPTQTVIQYAGNMGLISAGVGWDYGRRQQWETHLMLGILPKYHSSSTKVTMTLKENFIPWRVHFDDMWMFEPLTCGLYLNTVFGNDFWGRQPQRYPDDYYQFLSTRLRLNVFVGQRIGVIVPSNRRKLIKSITAFYEISTCDLYIRSMIQDHNVKLWDIIGLSLGLKFQVF